MTGRPRQNRVTPFGEIVAAPWRGALMGNRGILHDDARRLGTARWRHAHWVCCLTSFRGRHREIMPLPPARTRWTALFFWDEAGALAAGHRPCGECRYRDHRRFADAWAAAGLPGQRAAEFDRHLHAARVGRDRRQIAHRAASAGLPSGTFVATEAAPAEALLLWDAKVWQFDCAAGGYRPAAALPQTVTVLTPAPIVAVLRAGYRPDVRVAAGA